MGNLYMTHKTFQDVLSTEAVVWYLEEDDFWFTDERRAFQFFPMNLFRREVQLSNGHCRFFLLYFCLFQCCFFIQELL